MQIVKKWIAGLLFGLMGIYVLAVLSPFSGGGGNPEKTAKYERDARLQHNLDEIDRRAACEANFNIGC